MKNTGYKKVASDSWKSAGSYEEFMGRWSHSVAERFLKWLNIEPRLRWLEIGCGTGALTRAILTAADPTTITAIDPSEAYIAYCRARTSDKRALFKEGEIASIGSDTEQYDVIVSSLVLNFLPEPVESLALMGQAICRGGIIAAYVWDYSEGMQFLRYFWDAVVELDPRQASLHEGVRFGICKADALKRLFSSAGFGEIEMTAIDIPTPFRDFDDFWQPFTSGQGPAGSYCASLNDHQLKALKEILRVKVPSENDGSIALLARAWAIRGRK